MKLIIALFAWNLFEMANRAHINSLIHKIALQTLNHWTQECVICSGARKEYFDFHCQLNAFILKIGLRQSKQISIQMIFLFIYKSVNLFALQGAIIKRRLFDSLLVFHASPSLT